MGARKKIAADKRKEAMKSVAIARLVSVPTSPRKMRQSADTIRGLDVEKALGILRYRDRSCRGAKRTLTCSNETGRRAFAVVLVSSDVQLTFVGDLHCVIKQVANIGRRCPTHGAVCVNVGAHFLVVEIAVLSEAEVIALVAGGAGLVFRTVFALFAPAFCAEKPAAALGQRQILALLEWCGHDFIS